MSNSDFFKKINYKFNNLKFFREAITHKSYANQNFDMCNVYNERMEFLGDAVLDCIISEKLYELLPEAHEGRLTSLRIQLVRGKTLAEIARQIELGKVLLLGSGEDSHGGREKDSILADALEALIAAIFLDSGYETTKTVVLNIFRDVLDKTIKEYESDNYKSEFQELLQEQGPVNIEYNLVEAVGPSHDRTFFVEVFADGKNYGCGSGHSKKAAEQEAAKVAIGRVMRKNGE